MRSVLIAGVLACSTACSAITMPTARTVETTERGCTTVKVAPALDSVVAVAGGLVMVWGLWLVLETAADDNVDNPGVPYSIGALAAVPGAAGLTFWGLSARHGFRSANACARRG